MTESKSLHSMNVSFKWFLFKTHLLFVAGMLVALILICFSLVVFAHPDSTSVGMMVSVTGGLVSFAFLVLKHQYDEVRLFRELFTEFNHRYDGMNERLNALMRCDPEQALDADANKLLDDYFNLCAEEFLYFKKGFIDPEVWQAWKNGMKAFLTHPAIRSKWEQESLSDSYYGLTISE